MDTILGLSNLKYVDYDPCDFDNFSMDDDWHRWERNNDCLIIYYFSFDETLLKNFKKYLNIDMFSDRDKQVILNSYVSELTLCGDEIAFTTDTFEEIYATIPTKELDKFKKLIK